MGLIYKYNTDIYQIIISPTSPVKGQITDSASEISKGALALM